MGVKESPGLRRPRPGVLPVWLVVLAAALVAALMASCSQGPGPAADDEGDRAVLVEFYKGADGFGWRNKRNWLTNKPIGLWHGVTTDGSGRIIRLELPENRLSGRASPELGSLGNLQALDLSHNRLTGPIPPELGNLGNLTSLHLHGNGLSGPIPAELGDLGNLTVLSLFANELSGPIPAELGNLGNLEKLLLDTNELSGRVPAELENLSNLAVLSLNSNGLTGRLPPEVLGNMTKLRWLSLGENWLYGCVPTALRGQLTGARGARRGLPHCDRVIPPRPCEAGMTLQPGEYCTLRPDPPDSPRNPEQLPLFRVLDNDGCLEFLNRISCVTEVDIAEVRASRNSDGSWTVHWAY